VVELAALETALPTGCQAAVQAAVDHLADEGSGLGSVNPGDSKDQLLGVVKRQFRLFLGPVPNDQARRLEERVAPSGRFMSQASTGKRL